MWIINNDFDNLLIRYQLDRLIKPIDLSITTTDISSPTNGQTPSLSLSSSSSAAATTTTAAALPTAAALNFFHVKNMIELTVESARLREKQLENEIGIYDKVKSFSSVFEYILFCLVDLRNELTKEQDCRQKLEQDILELRRIKSE